MRKLKKHNENKTREKIAIHFFHNDLKLCSEIGQWTSILIETLPTSWLGALILWKLNDKSKEFSFL